MADKKNSVEDVLKSLQSDVEGSYKRASEQITTVRSEVEGVQGSVRFMGWLTVVALVVLGYATSVAVKHDKYIFGNGLKELLNFREGELADKIVSEKVKPLIPSEAKIKKVAGELDRSDADVKKLAGEVANAAVAKVPARRTDDEIKKIAVANNRTDKDINALAGAVAQAAVKKVPARRSDAEIKKIAVANNRTDKDINTLAAKVAAAAVAKVPARRSDKEITALAKSADWSKKEIESMAMAQAKKAVKAVPARRSDKEIDKIAKQNLENFSADLTKQMNKILAAIRKEDLALRKELKKLKEQNAALAQRIDTLGAAPSQNSDVEKCLRALAKVRSKRVIKKLKLASADLSKIDFSKAKLSDVEFKSAKLSGVSFKDCLMENVNFENADLRGADLRIEAFKNIKFTGATYDDKTKFDASLLDLNALGAVKK